MGNCKPTSAIMHKGGSFFIILMEEQADMRLKAIVPFYSWEGQIDPLSKRRLPDTDEACLNQALDLSLVQEDEVRTSHFSPWWDFLKRWYVVSI